MRTMRPEKRRRERLQMLVTEAERQAIEQAADREETTVSDWMRRAALLKLGQTAPA